MPRRTAGGAPHSGRSEPDRDYCRAHSSQYAELNKPVSADDCRLTKLERDLAAAKQRIAELEQENRDLVGRLEQIVALAFGPFGIAEPARAAEARPASRPSPAPQPHSRTSIGRGADDDIQGAARKLLSAAAQHAPGGAAWASWQCLPGSNRAAGISTLVASSCYAKSGYVEEANHLVGVTKAGLKAAWTVPPSPSILAERLALWCERLPAPAPEILRMLAAQGEHSMSANELAAVLGKKPSGGHWNSGIAVLRNNGLIEADPIAGAGRRYRLASCSVLDALQSCQRASAAPAQGDRAMKAFNATDIELCTQPVAQS